MDPVSYDRFKRNHYERCECLIFRDQPGYFDKLLTVQDLDTVLCTHSLDPSWMNLVNAKEDLPKTRFLDDSGRVDPLSVAREFNSGATVIFHQLQRRVSSLSRLCVTLGRFLGSRMQTNVYLTPPNSQGFSPHWDTHDVFVLQVFGRKKWSMYGNQVTLPLKGQGFERDKLGSASVKTQFVCSPGSVVYIPRGEVHSAEAMEEPSCHITLGMTAFTWMDFFLEGVAAAALEDVALRESLPIGLAHRNGRSLDREAQYAWKLKRLLSGLDAERLWKHFEDRVNAANKPMLSNLLQSGMTLDTLCQESRVQWRWGSLPEMLTQPDHAEIRCAGLRMTVPARLKAAAAFVVATPRFAVRDLPEGVTLQEKVGFVYRLIQEGLLERVDLCTGENEYEGT